VTDEPGGPDEPLPEVGPLDEGDDDPDELAGALELDDEELSPLLDPFEEELTQELLDDAELDPDDDIEDELPGQQPRPSARASHLRLSAKRRATPYVPAGTAVASPHEQVPLDEPVALHNPEQTMPIAS